MAGWKFTPDLVDGVNVNDGTTYVSYFEFPDNPMQLVTRKAIEVGIPGDYSFPFSPRSQPASARIIVHTELKDLNQTSLNALRRIFDRMKGEIVAQVRDGDNNPWTAMVKIERFVPEGPNRWLSELYLARPIFEQATLNTDGPRAITASPTSFDLAPVVGGTVRSRPTIALTPTAAKTNANDYRNRWQVSIAWRSELPGEDSLGQGGGYLIDVADDSLDTAAEVAAGRMLASGDDLRVFVDGVEYPRKLDGINTTTSKVWVPIHFSPGKSVLLAAAASGTSPADGATWNVQDGETLLGWPERGRFKVDNETVWYGARTDTKFQLIDRGFANSVAAAHSGGARADWVEHDIQIVSNYSGAVAPAAAVLAIDAAVSTNLAHKYATDFVSLGVQKYGQMLARFTEDNVKAAVLSVQDSGGRLVIADRAAGGTYYPYNNAELYVPCGVKAAASALAFDVSGGDIGTLAPGADVALSSRVYGIDIATGVERLLATYDKAARATTAKTITPDVVLQRIRLNALYTAITGAWNNTAAAGDFDVGAAGFPGSPLFPGQEFTLDAYALITAIAVMMKKAAGATRNVHVGVLDGGDTPILETQIANADFATTYKWVYRTATHVLPAKLYTLGFPGAGAGAGQMFMRRMVASYAKGRWADNSAYRPEYDATFLIIGDGSVVQAEAPSGMEGYVGWDNLVVTFDNTTPRTPSIVRAAQETIYILRPTLEHVDHGQTIDVFYIAALNETLQVDCKNKLAILDSAKNRYAPGAVTPSDPEQWMHLKASGVAADNTLRYTEAGVGGGSSLNMTTTWRDYWG